MGIRVKVYKSIEQCKVFHTRTHALRETRKAQKDTHSHVKVLGNTSMYICYLIFLQFIIFLASLHII